jgi:hypothetical protein
MSCSSSSGRRITLNPVFTLVQELRTEEMFLCALGNAVPEASLSQLDCFEVLKTHRAYDELSARGKEICKLVLTGDNGITHRFHAQPWFFQLCSFLCRQFCTSDYASIPDMSSDDLNHYFRCASFCLPVISLLILHSIREHAPRLGACALQKALVQVESIEIDCMLHVFSKRCRGALPSATSTRLLFVRVPATFVPAYRAT